MSSSEKIYLAKRISAIVAIITWVIALVLTAITIYNWIQAPHMPVIHDHFFALIGFIPIVSGFHPGIWCFDIAVLASIVWLFLHSFYSKENRCH
ncbi:hypothetical protein [Lactobacillus kefiranofaciens]|uniref:Uncharacterized protein n=1 Tax=Lactobacillus kefiranofaciens TaxID=267818 RepID=A0AAX3UCA0_9LACO|nr:hypothetical protein [Lactobacillus kefiranofaciens]AEG41270.1 DedA family protein [Lactobacillus kefiranofaciens subsp. kefiranofaciens]MCJ2172918.1 hypothetical protein [Lactobacillus kefiranofaciens]MCP9330638.1 hypothetical protein [Lactobacillus kefiranofaciens]MDH5100661.1 hypothetical protein [Lactobacillus kefiranofaciens]PAK97484.1 hypothetical protein B8W86_09765 [Lactobacillus kefiranofaciens]